MPIIGDLFKLVFLGPLANLLVLIIHALQAIGIPGVLGFSIIILTIIIRAATWKVFSAQLRSAKKIADLKPHLDELKRKHQDKQEYAKAQMDLYKEHGVNPAGGCLPTLIQLPILIALYQTILSLFNPGGLDRINSLLYSPSLHLSSAPDPFFLGFNLAHKPSEFAIYGVGLLLIPILTAALTFFQSKMMTPPKPLKVYPSDSSKEKKEKESTEEAMMAMQGQMVYLMPLMIGFFAWQFPVGLALYWNSLTLFGIFQQYLINGWGGMQTLIDKLPLKKS